MRLTWAWLPCNHASRSAERDRVTAAEPSPFADTIASREELLSYLPLSGY